MTRNALHIFTPVLLGQAEWDGPNRNEARCRSACYDTALHASVGGSVGPALRASLPAPRRHAAEAAAEEQKRRGGRSDVTVGNVAEDRGRLVQPDLGEHRLVAAGDVIDETATREQRDGDESAVASGHSARPKGRHRNRYAPER